MDLEVSEHDRAGVVEIPGIMWGGLVVPAIFAGAGIQRPIED
jgi:hypothetical protein